MAGENILLDTMGRRNRKLPDKNCENCGILFRPLNCRVRTCSISCGMAIRRNPALKLRKKETWWVNSKGYVNGRVWIDENTQINVKKHRWIMEQHLGRKLHADEDVHHIDENKLNNEISNLEIRLHGDHSTYHNNKRLYKSGYKMNLTNDERLARSIKAKENKIWTKSPSYKATK